MNPPEFCLLEINWWPLCMQKGEWASWVQAVFSVAAIGAAIWIGHRNDAKAREGARNYLTMFKSAAKSAIRYTLNAAGEQDYVNYSLGRAMIHDAIQLGQTAPFDLLAGNHAFTALRYRTILSTAGAAVERNPRAPEWVSIEFMQVAQILSELMADLQRVDEHKTGSIPEDWK